MVKSSRQLLVMLLVGWPVLSLLVHAGPIGHWVLEYDASLLQVVGRIALWAILGAGLSMPMWASWDRYFSRDVRPSIQLIALLVLSLFAGLGLAALMEVSHWPLPIYREPRRPGPPFWSRAVMPILSMYAWSAMQFTLTVFQRLAQERERALKAEALAVEARLAMLRYELNPHFLFNTLNSIIGVIDEEPSRAQEMVRQLAGLLRHALHSPPESTLGDELKVAQKYLAIEKVRFEERLKVEIDVPEALHPTPIQPMLLQPLVENAVKHGLEAGLLVVRVEAEDVSGVLVIRVSNPGQLRNSGGGVGLRNLRERLGTHSEGAAFTIEQRGEFVVAEVTLPLEVR